eukprot:m.161989 g.161989  ORF g.161989 m.161989 type:complete len:550 (-) comp15195_c0_seq1:4663-6312(-)
MLRHWPSSLFATSRCALTRHNTRTVLSWSTVDPKNLSESTPGVAQNLVGGQWTTTRDSQFILDPLNGEKFLQVPATSIDELEPFVKASALCPKYGMHNPLYRVERYSDYGSIVGKAANMLTDPKIADFFTKLIQRVAPKHEKQAASEVTTVQKWLQYMSGDQVRMLARSFGVPGDHAGQESRGYRWPFGKVAVITPFNFPFEISSIQVLSSLFMGNRPLVKVDEKVSIVCEQFVRMLIHCGMPATDLDLIYSSGPVANDLLKQIDPAMTLFTGSQAVAEKLSADLRGRVKLEDAGFNWKIIGPDVKGKALEYISWQCDHDAYGFCGQKCSAQSILFAHSNSVKDGIFEKITALASNRNLNDLTITPLLSVTNEMIEKHIDACLQIPGAKIMFGGKRLQGHSIPDRFGSFEPTAIFIPLKEIAKPENFEIVETEIFGPFQIVTEYQDDDLELILDLCHRMENHLSAGLVSNDTTFVNKVLGRTTNGTSYVGFRGRTTGAPAQHWFGPCGDPRSGGIHTVEAIQSCWSGHREIVHDTLLPDLDSWTQPTQS